ncbi:MAG TPA: hypothetical protein VGI32_01630 [Steroidobacteraceae bacterium]|jgi:hypothetical protein
MEQSLGLIALLVRGGRVFLFLHTDDFWRDYILWDLLQRPARRA